MNLGEGAVLFQIPKGAGRLKIKTAAITNVSTGATGIIERHGQFYVKVVVLEGDSPMLFDESPRESLLVPYELKSQPV